jgi:RimJ/RimL family protein N-acetyltransferase
MALFAKYIKKSSERNSFVEKGVLIRDCRYSDLPEAAKIQSEREGGELFYHQTRLASFFKKTRDPQRANFKLAELNNRITGFGKCEYLNIPDNAPQNSIPEGWYLSGLIVAPDFRRHGIGLELTKARIDWLSGKTNIVYYFANSDNLVTIELHEKLGFKEIKRNIWAPGLSQEEIHILYCLHLDL